MPGARVFIDTNIWIYAHLKVAEDRRHDLARALIDGESDIVISPQVIAEYYSVMLRNGRADDWIQANLRAMFTRVRLQPVTAEVVVKALALRKRYGFSYWDCQIAAAALEAGCVVLLTEDMQDGQLLDKQLKIINPLI